MTRRKQLLGVLIALALSGNASGQIGPATTAGIDADASAAARGVMMHALQSGATHPGCNTLPAGWATLQAIVKFPAEYGGYPQWVNTAELLPVGEDLQSFIKTGSARGAFWRPALRVDPSTVRMILCAPAGFSYWVLVDSGMARVVVGQVWLTRSSVTYRENLLAPPLGGASGSSSASQSQASSPSSGAGSGGSGNSWHPPQTDESWKPPQTDNSWRPPQTDNSWKPPQTDNHWKPPQSDGGPQ